MVDVFCKMDNYKLLNSVPGELGTQDCSWTVSFCSKAVDSLSTTIPSEG